MPDRMRHFCTSNKDSLDFGRLYLGRPGDEGRCLLQATEEHVSGYQIVGLPNIFTGRAGTAVSMPVRHLGTSGWYDFLQWGPLGTFELPAQQFASMVREVDDSAVIYARVSGDALDLWVVVATRDGTAETAIAERLCSLIEAYPGFPFDYMLLEHGTETDRLISDHGYRKVTPAGL